MRLVIEIDAQEISERLGELNDERRQDGREGVAKRDLLALLKSDDFRRDQGSAILDTAIEMIG